MWYPRLDTMSAQPPADTRSHLLEDLHSFDRLIARVEIALLVVMTGLLILLYVGNIVLRVGWRMNIAWLETLLKPGVLWIGLMGASLATRENKHISVEAVSKFTTKKTAQVVGVFVNLFAAVVVGMMAVVASYFLLDALDESPNVEAARVRVEEAFQRLDSLDVVLKAARRWDAVDKVALQAARDEGLKAMDELALAQSALQPRPKVYAEVLHLDLPKSAPFPSNWLAIEKAHFELDTRVRNWHIFLILPIALWVMCFRFGLHLLDLLGARTEGGALGRLASRFDHGLALYDVQDEDEFADPAPEPDETLPGVAVAPAAVASDASGPELPGEGASAETAEATPAQAEAELEPDEQPQGGQPPEASGPQSDGEEQR